MKYTLPAAEELSTLDHYRLGRLYRFPLCCVVEFTLRGALGRWKGRDTATFGKRVHPEIPGAGPVEYVECVLHRRFG